MPLRGGGGELHFDSRELSRPTVGHNEVDLRAAVNAALTVAVRQARLAAFDVRQFEITDDDIATARADRSESR